MNKIERGEFFDRFERTAIAPGVIISGFGNWSVVTELVAL